jgi:hypothetical protein
VVVDGAAMVKSLAKRLFKPQAIFPFLELVAK